MYRLLEKPVVYFVRLSSIQDDKPLAHWNATARKPAQWPEVNQYEFLMLEPQ
jgi:hypothetical protein